MALPTKVIRKRKRLYTMPQLAAQLGVDVSTVYRLERMPVPDLVKRYLALVGYQCQFYPKRKDKA